jgi:two-component system, chemotaxis family, sensor kinase CheA
MNGNPADGKPVRSIQKKLMVNSAAVLTTALLGLLAVVIGINTSLSAEHTQSSVANIREALIAKGNILVSNNSQALEEMVADNAILAVTNLVASTVRDDEDVVYGIYMDGRRQPWVHAGPGNPGGEVNGPAILNDSASLWAAAQRAPIHRRLSVGGGEVMEFVAPVRAEGEITGMIRYGLTTAGMHASIAETSRTSHLALHRTIAALVALGLMALGFSFLATRRLAARITRPIEELQVAANAIAGGDYRRPVIAEGDDEIARLAQDFEIMRKTVKLYTERLQEMVDEKTQEVRDILDNIEQGLFAVDLQGSVKPDYALSTNAILSVGNVAGCDLGQLFHVEGDRLAEWLDWLEVVRQKHAVIRWDKLARLSPIQELELRDAGGIRHIHIGYQRMFDRQKKLSGLMILPQDVTEARRIEKMMREERERHENEVQAILGVVHNAGAIPDFLEDAEARLADLERHLGRGRNSRASPSDDELAAVFRDLHTLKGTSSTYGFEMLARISRESEEVLAGFREGDRPLSGDDMAAMAVLLQRLREALEEIRDLAKRLIGRGGVATIAEPTLRLIRELCDAVEPAYPAGGAEPLSRLIKACREIEFVPLGKLAEKYTAMLERVGERLGKRLRLRVQPESLSLSPHIFSALDVPLVHLLRNAADHGIEAVERRAEAGKDEAGLVQLLIESGEDGFHVTVSDDGAGIDVGRVADKALAMGVATSEELAAMTDAEKAELIFSPGLSTRDESTDISGMGVGMDAVAVWAKAAGGRASVVSRPGLGTSITLHLPSLLGKARA